MHRLFDESAPERRKHRRNSRGIAKQKSPHTRPALVALALSYDSEEISTPASVGVQTHISVPASALGEDSRVVDFNETKNSEYADVMQCITTRAGVRTCLRTKHENAF
jgi:hypothetical protein